MSFKVVLLAIVICAVQINFGYGLSTFRLVSSNTNVSWTLENKNGSIKIPGSVPGGVYSDLQKAGIISNILTGFNDVLTRWVAYDTWTYTAKFVVNDVQLNSNVANLVLHGVDTVSYIELNESPVGSTNNMFVRYVYDVKQYLKPGLNVLKVTFDSPVWAARNRSLKHFTAPECVPYVYNGECHANQLRKMQASFSWDWGPAFPSVGLWKSAALEFYTGAIIRSVTTHTEKKDQHWKLKILAYLETSQKRQSMEGLLGATLQLEGAQTVKVEKSITINFDNEGIAKVELIMDISENVVRLWWPNGFGEQPLYKLHVYLSTYNDGDMFDKYLQIGFRTVEVVEENATFVLGNTTAGKGLTFYFKVNGYPLFMKGSNWIPAHILPEYGADKQTVDELLMAAHNTHMAMLRVWGGGVYESDYFYERCDQLGILIWQDFLFACSMYPVDEEFLQTVKMEIEQNVIRLQHHPSIALWAGNNENEVALRGNWYGTETKFEQYKKEYIKLYVATIKPIVEAIDPERHYLVSSPSNGLKSEEDGYIAENPYDAHYGDTHYYNYLADNWNMYTFPETRFASEYGFQALPSLKTMRTATTTSNDYHIDSEYSKHRQHSPNGYDYIESQITRHLQLEKNDSAYFSKFIFYSQISQAMIIKVETEYYRQSQADWYTMGALYWQLNDVWQAPSWSGIEYGGKWKMMHYFAKSFFAPVLVSPRILPLGDVDVVQCYLINDRFVPITNARIIVEVFNWSNIMPISSESYPASVGPLGSKKQNININLWNIDTNNEIFLRFSLMAEGVPYSPFNYVFPKPLKDIKGLRRPNIHINVVCTNKTRDQRKHTVEIVVDTVVLFLWLETNNLNGQFEDNGFIVTQPRFRVEYISKTNISCQMLQQDITYQYYVH